MHALRSCVLTNACLLQHTSRAVVRGSSNYLPNVHQLGWYYPRALELNKQNVYLLMDDTYDRVGTVGFRCVVDAI